MGYTLRNSNGMSLTVLALGGIIQKLTAADRHGRYDDVVLGFDSESDYERSHPYFGAIVGRYANRIARGRFAVDGSEYTVVRNDGKNHLHGGSCGFDKVTWQVDATDQELRLQYVSVDGEEGYPGELTVTVCYSLTDDDSLRIDYRAETTKPTPVNLTSHPYFNLAGNGSILEHELEIFATSFTPTGTDLIPTGSIESVSGTPLDFRQPVAIGERIESHDEQIRNARGYDHNYVLDKPDDALALAARVTDPTSGRVMEVLTTAPGLQFYSGNSLSGIRGKAGLNYGPHSGLCLEAQHFPDSPNQATFPSTVIRPGDVYASTTIYRFFTIKSG